MRAEPACSVVVNVYARTRLAMDLRAEREADEISFTLAANLLRGMTGSVRAFVRLAGPTRDLSSLVQKQIAGGRLPRAMQLDAKDDPKFDAARILAKLESDDPAIATIRDEELPVVSHGGGALHAHAKKAVIAGVYHAGLWVEGVYDPGGAPSPGHQHGHAAPPGTAKGAPERFERLVTVAISVGNKGSKTPAHGKTGRRGRRRRSRHEARSVQNFKHAAIQLVEIQCSTERQTLRQLDCRRVSAKRAEKHELKPGSKCIDPIDDCTIRCEAGVLGIVPQNRKNNKISAA